MREGWPEITEGMYAQFADFVPKEPPGTPKYRFPIQRVFESGQTPDGKSFLIEFTDPWGNICSYMSDRFEGFDEWKPASTPSSAPEK